MSIKLIDSEASIKRLREMAGEYHPSDVAFFLINKAADAIEKMPEIENPVVHLHRLCKYMEEQKHDSPYSAESWEAQDDAYRKKCVELRECKEKLDTAEAALERLNFYAQGGVDLAWNADPHEKDFLEHQLKAAEARVRELEAAQHTFVSDGSYPKRPTTFAGDRAREVERDAKRYQWLRVMWPDWDEESWEAVTPDTFDKAIDDAMDINKP